MATEAECLEALRAAARELGESPTKAQYEDLGLTPAASTILRVCGGWNEAKEAAGLETCTQEESGGRQIQPKPPDVETPADEQWEELTPQQRWYYKNRRHRIASTESRRKRLREWFTAYKHEHCECERCGESEPPCLDFHHPDGKERGVSQMVNHGYARARILEEAEKCRVLCANCHRKAHAKTGDNPPPDESVPAAASGNDTRLHRRRRWLAARKRERGGCTRCDESDPACLDFHHVGHKTMGVSKMIVRQYPLERVQEELQQCDLLCANCHRKEHHGE
jgi:hypothetical protein